MSIAEQPQNSGVTDQQGAGRRSYRAVHWARDVIERFGLQRPDGSYLIRLSQSDLNEYSGWSRSSGAVAAYLQALGQAVISRRPLILDASALSQLERTWANERPLRADAARAARDLALRFGRPGPAGTILVTQHDGNERPATVNDMATALGITTSAMTRRLDDLKAQGRIVRTSGFWVFPEQTRVEEPHQEPDESTKLGRALLAIFVELESTADQLRTAAQRSATSPVEVARFSRDLDHALLKFSELHIPDPHLPGTRPQ